MRSVFGIVLLLVVFVEVVKIIINPKKYFGDIKKNGPNLGFTALTLAIMALIVLLYKGLLF